MLLVVLVVIVSVAAAVLTFPHKTFTLVVVTQETDF